MRIVVTTILALCLSGVANAQSFTPELDEICMPNPMPAGARGGVDREALLDAVFATAGIERRNLRGLTLDDKLQAILNNRAFCMAPGRCSKEIEAKFGQANALLFRFLQRNSRSIAPGSSGFEVSPPISSSTDLAQVAQSERLVEGFLRGKGPLRVACVAGPVAPADEAHAQAKNILTGIAVRKSIDDLAAAPSGDSFRSAGRASISYTDDGIKGTRTLNSEGVAGYKLSDSLLSPRNSATLFATYYGNRIWANDPKDEENIGNVGAGILGKFGFDLFNMSQSIQVFGHYVHSHVTNSDIFSTKLTMSPNLGLPGVGRIFIPGNTGPLAFAFDPQLKLVYGSVLNAGSNPLLIDTHDYARGGGKIAFWIFGIDGIFKNFTFNTSYESLKVWRGALDTVSRFESALSYTLGDQENWAIELKYVNGRNVDTLEREQIVKLGLGYKQ